MKKILFILSVLALASCTNVSQFAVAVDDENIYYNECLTVLLWHKCELKSKPTIGKPVMQRVQTVISSDNLSR